MNKRRAKKRYKKLYEDKLKKHVPCWYMYSGYFRPQKIFVKTENHNTFIIHVTDMQLHTSPEQRTGITLNGYVTGR